MISLLDLFPSWNVYLLLDSSIFPNPPKREWFFSNVPLYAFVNPTSVFDEIWYYIVPIILIPFLFSFFIEIMVAARLALFAARNENGRGVSGRPAASSCTCTRVETWRVWNNYFAYVQVSNVILITNWDNHSDLNLCFCFNTISYAIKNKSQLSIHDFYSITYFNREINSKTRNIDWIFKCIAHKDLYSSKNTTIHRKIDTYFKQNQGWTTFQREDLDSKY